MREHNASQREHVMVPSSRKDQQNPSPRALDHASALRDRQSTAEAALLMDTVSATFRLVRMIIESGAQACHEVVKRRARMNRNIKNPVLDFTWEVWNGRLLPIAHGRHVAGTDPLSTLEPHH